MLGLVMFGMGLTLKPTDFKPILVHPKEMLIGEMAQFLIMPASAWLLCQALHLPSELALGVILVGCCPGGTASNVICYLAKGDIALSVAMTGVSTLLAPLVTPALVLGLAVNHFFRTLSQRLTPLLPMVSTLAIAAIIGIIVSHNAASILSCSLLVAAVVILHNLLGLTLGYGIGWLSGIDRRKATAIAIEVGMQNSGLATSLAATHFALYPMAAVPGAIFSVWHNFSGSLAAQLFRRGNESPRS